MARRAGAARTSPAATSDSAAARTTTISRARVLLNAVVVVGRSWSTTLLTQVRQRAPAGSWPPTAPQGGPDHPSGPPHAVLRLAFLFASPRPTDARANQPNPDTRSPKGPAPSGFGVGQL